MSVGAALLTSDEARKAFVSEVNRCCVVVEVAVYPVKDKPQVVSLDDFSVRVTGSETAVKPSSAKVVAASIQKSAESQRDITVSPSVGVGYESGPYGGHGSYTEVGLAVGWANRVPTQVHRIAIATRCRGVERERVARGQRVSSCGGLPLLFADEEKECDSSVRVCVQREKIVLPLP